MSRSLKRSVWALMAAPSRIEQLSAISSILPNTSNTSLGGCPPGSYPSARWRKYSERDKQHFLANIVTFFFSVTVTRMLIPRRLFGGLPCGNTLPMLAKHVPLRNNSTPSRCAYKVVYFPERIYR